MHERSGYFVRDTYNANSNVMKYLRARRRIYELFETGSFFLFSYPLFVFFCGLPSLLLSLTARINPNGAVKEFSRNSSDTSSCCR